MHDCPATTQCQQKPRSAVSPGCLAPSPVTCLVPIQTIGSISLSQGLPNMRLNRTPEQEPKLSPKQHHSADPPPPKRRRLSEQFSASDGHQREGSNANSRPGNLSSGRSPQRTGSSRERRGEMERSPSPAGSVRYTRTGRVSKAAKGQRVHACDECGKVRLLFASCNIPWLHPRL